MNTLYYGDNLNILRRYGGNTRGSKCVPFPRPSTGVEPTDILSTGPGFRLSGAEADSLEWLSEDTWHWKGAASTYDDLIPRRATRFRKCSRRPRSFIGENQMMAYLVMMAVRLKELHRVLAPPGSLYLHCDPTAPLR